MNAYDFLISFKTFFFNHSNDLIYNHDLCFMDLQQNDFDVVWYSGTIAEKNFEPWMDSMRNEGCEFVKDKVVTDLFFNEET